MPIYRDPKSPYWFVRFTIAGVKTRRSTGTTDREAAKEFESKLRADLWRQVRLGERPRYTFREARERWFREADTRGRDADNERLSWFAEHLDDIALVDITREAIEKLKLLRLKQCRKVDDDGEPLEAAPSTVNRYMAMLRMILRKAQREWDWIERAPVVPMMRVEKSEPRFLTHAQAGKLIKALPAHLAEVTEFALETGVRMRNATHLTWPQVDMRRRQAIVRAADAKAGETIALPLSARAMAILKARQAAFAKLKKDNAKAPAVIAERVFWFRSAGFSDANGATFKAAAKSAGVAWLRFHDLRHTWASWHIQRGTPLHVLQELGGWKSYEMVRRYAHLTTEHLRAYVK